MTDGNGGGPTTQVFTGDGFGTLTVRTPQPEILQSTPRVISNRAVLRRGLPAVYQDSDFAMRFIGALEEVIDPLTGTLDGLHHYVDPRFAPHAFLELLCAWLGIEVGEAPELEDMRRRTHIAIKLGRLRGTAEGLRLTLELRFPDLPLRVEDAGAVTWPGGPPLADGPAGLVVYCDQPVEEQRKREIARYIEREKPVHATYRLRFKNKQPAP